MEKVFFGGSFDPPHLGHLGVARAALASGRCSEVVWFPSRTPPHKLERERAPFRHRMKMIELLIGGESGMSVSGFEDELKLARSYTAEVLRALERETGERYGLLIGADSLLALHTWYRAEELAENYEFITYPRAGSEVTRKKLLEHWPEKTVGKLMKSMLTGTFFEISSTGTRKTMEKNAFMRHIISVDGIPECILEYIAANGLYRVSVSGKGRL